MTKRIGTARLSGSESNLGNKRMFGPFISSTVRAFSAGKGRANNPQFSFALSGSVSRGQGVSSDRGSAIRPNNAEAAAVSGEHKKTESSCNQLLGQVERQRSSLQGTVAPPDPADMRGNKCMSSGGKIKRDAKRNFRCAIYCTFGVGACAFRCADAAVPDLSFAPAAGGEGAAALFAVGSGCADSVLRKATTSARCFSFDMLAKVIAVPGTSARGLVSHLFNASNVQVPPLAFNAPE